MKKTTSASSAKATTKRRADPFYITTPIYYINDQPHIGHAYTTIAADVLARYQRQQGREVLFATGTDENSLKTVRAAEAAGQSIADYTKQMAASWEQTWKELDISFDRFIRTTEPVHTKAVIKLIELIDARGDIYQDTYEGLYCVGHEAFIKAEELVDGKCPEHGTAPEPVKEQNYFFKLSKYADLLLRHIESQPQFIQPETRRNEVIAFIKQGLEDISISRATQKWGIKLPQDKKQVVYVWFDALINYLTVTGYPAQKYTQWWPASVHLIGKDIIKFHCVIWPAMLLSAGIELPRQVTAHGFFTIDGAKISKSLGNAINPLELAADFGVDALRYYLLREIPFGSDGEFTHQRFTTVYNADLANELGNLLQRVVTMVERYQEGSVGELPRFSHDVSHYHQAMGELRFDRALATVWELIKGLNQFLEEEKPWELAENDPEHLREVLAHAVIDLRQIGELLAPFMPTTAARISQSVAGDKVERVGILFPKKDD